MALLKKTLGEYADNSKTGLKIFLLLESSLIFNCLPFHFCHVILSHTAVGLNPDRDFGFFHVRKLSS
jgi:hypothetical protein